MRPAGCPPISMSKNTTGLDMMMMFLRVRFKEKMRKFDDDGTRFPFFLSKKRNEKVPTILQHHTKINATKAISLSISILFKEPMTSKEPLVY